MDTNVIIDSFGNKLPEKAIHFLLSFAPVVSAVTKIEVLGWLNATPEQIKPLEVFMEYANILPINDAVINQTVVIRQHTKIGLGDAIIATTALVYDLTIISRNTKDFQNIDGLKVIDPYSL
jgi:predicted nucleic acid-binding protein